MLSLGLLFPLGNGSMMDRIAATVAAVADPGPAKHVTLIRDGVPETLETHARTPDALLAERGVLRADDDSLSIDPQSPLNDGATITYRAAVPVTIIVDGQTRQLRSAASTVGALLAAQGVAYDRHDELAPAASAPLANDVVVNVRHVDAWTETIRDAIRIPVVKRFAYTLPAGRSQVISAGRSGVREVRYSVARMQNHNVTRRTLLLSRVLRAPQARIIAEGVGEYAALTHFAERGIAGTLKLASSALSMVATAYTASCGGCTGTTASGRPAGHGVVAVDPAVIPLGTHMYIPGYGHAVAGDTGGAIRGKRIDLGFDSNAAANEFGRRPITVYLIK